ncbi:AAA family ATPase [Streptomyces liangshanensis]|uniref:AAA family ATPase n=2 Tax=Streptomyces liangshanensis TaxID=2717324 RepID=A0A6G9GUK1_9ACTN|nr:helix-turn-helix transcriptional regulator [Streptomyces liangshanensis]QIQ01880.1 AAA family ATPase [Streptomyces liangshanensis]
MLDGMTSAPVSSRFVGRGDALSALAAALRRSDQGVPQKVLISGEAGVGKTRLVEEFAETARIQGAWVAVGECIEIEAGGLPLQAFTTLLRSLLSRSTEEVAPFLEGFEEELSGILPEWGRSSLITDPGEGQGRLFALMGQLLERLAAERTVIVVLEDLHWADASTRSMLTYLFRTLRQGRLLLVATYRSDDLHRRHPLRPFLAESDRLRSVVRIDVPRFTRDEVREQVREIISADPEPSEIDRIFARSDGNAFFVEELVRAFDVNSRADLSDSLRGLLLARILSLPENVQKVVGTVAEGGAHVEYDLLRRVSPLPEYDLIEALRVAVDAQILWPTRDGDGYRFRHSLVREAADQELLPGERARLNRLYAEAVSADPSLVPAEERTARLATYWYVARDAKNALVVTLEAAVEARRRYAYAEQSQLLERAMELREIVPPDALPTRDHPGHPDYPDQLDLMADAAVSTRLSGDRQRALSIAKQGTSTAEARADTQRAAWFWIQRSELVQELGMGTGRQELDQAHELVRRSPPSVFHAEVLVAVAAWGARHEPGPESLADAQHAVEFARQAKAEHTELHARVIRAWLTASAGGFDESIEDLYRVRRTAQELDSVSALGRVSITLPSTLEAAGRSAEAVAAGEEGIRTCRARGLTNTEAWVRCNLSQSLASLGQWEPSRRAAEEAARIANSRKARALVALRLTQIALMRGEVKESKRQLALARGLFGTDDPQPQFLITPAEVAIRIAALEGRLADARAEFARIVSVGFPAGTEQYALPLLCAMADVEAKARGASGPDADPERESVLATIRRQSALVRPLAPVWHAYHLLLKAQVRRAEGTANAEDWAEVAGAFAGRDRPYEQALARTQWAAALLTARADRAAAAEQLTEAYRAARLLGARLLMDELLALASRSRISLDAGTADAEPDDAAAQNSAASTATPDADATASFGLTAREIEVLRLLAEGNSNRRIGEELFISPKTASVHVSHILDKLGLSSRGEAAALAHRLGLAAAEEAG